MRCQLELEVGGVCPRRAVRIFLLPLNHLSTASPSSYPPLHTQPTLFGASSDTSFQQQQALHTDSSFKQLM